MIRQHLLNHTPADQNIVSHCHDLIVCILLFQSLLGLNQESLGHCMTQSVTKTRGEAITRFYTKDHAEGQFNISE